MDNNRSIIHTFKKKPNEEFQIAIRMFNDRQFIDLRLWYLPPSQKQFKPTKKGVMVGLEFLPEIQKGVQLLQDFNPQKANN